MGAVEVAVERRDQRRSLCFRPAPSQVGAADRLTLAGYQHSRVCVARPSTRRGRRERGPQQPDTLATSTAQTRSITSSCSASGTSSGTGRCVGLDFNSLAPNRVHTPGDRLTASVKGTEILTGVLEARVRAHSRSAPGVQAHDSISVPTRPCRQVLQPSGAAGGLWGSRPRRCLDHMAQKWRTFGRNLCATDRGRAGFRSVTTPRGMGASG